MPTTDKKGINQTRLERALESFKRVLKSFKRRSLSYTTRSKAPRIKRKKRHFWSFLTNPPRITLNHHTPRHTRLAGSTRLHELRPELITTPHTGKLRNIAIAQGFTDFVRLLSGYDAIIQVGGSFFVDLYGVPQFEHALCTFMAKKPLFMIGHSVGPFQDEQFNQLANYVFGHCDALILRESVSLDLMKRSNITTAKVEHGVDTAWLVDHHTEDFTASYAVQHWLDVAAQQKTVAITLRELAPFDKRLGTTQQAYEKAFAGVVNRILDEGYQVIALSTCTGIDSYNKDDRMVALNLRQHISDPARYHVVMDELNDLEMGKILAACELTVGTRLHSAIISMNFATPAIAINYEHKSAGIMQQVGLPEMAIDIRHLLDGSLQAMVADTLGQLPALNTRLNEAVSRERQTGMQMVQSVLERIGEVK
ncbi:colanic acid biosynthesis pyruvyl transferase WcaK [Escherichia coli]